MRFNLMETKKPDLSTPGKKKRYVESESQRMADVLDEVTGRSEEVLMRGSYAARRQRALLNVLDRAEQAFPKCWSAAATLTRFEFSPMMNYNHLDQEDEFEIGAAIWILETLRKTDYFVDAIKILPDMAGDYDNWYVPMDFSYPRFDSDLFRAVIHVLKCRHEGKDILSLEAAEGEKPTEVFLQLMEFLPREAVEKACAAFKEKQWELITRYMKCQEYFDRETQKLISLSKSSALTVTAFNPEDSREKAEQIQFLSKTLPMDFEKYLLDERRNVIRKTGSRDIADATSGFVIDNPYEICFALIYLIESGDDAPWLIESGSLLSYLAMRMLPWFVDKEDWDDEDWEAWLDEMVYNRNGWVQEEDAEEPLDFFHTMHKGQNLAQIIYGLCRCVVPIGLHPFEKDRKSLIEEGMDEATARKVTDIAELLFHHEFQGHPYSPQKYFFKEDVDDEEESTEPVDIGEYQGRVAAEQGADEVADSSELKKAKKEIDALREALYAERREMNADRAKYERELKTLRMEHRELADLRELVFNQQSDAPERLEKTDRKIDYPYQTKKRTVVFGGHDSFLQAIKPLLPDVKYVDASNMTYSPEIIRNADVVWVQNNCISHPQYWSIVKNCKLAGVQMRYFGYASAEKCAEQLVTEDLRV